MDFIYDNTGKPYALKYDGTLYYYVLNLQGDVISIVTHWGESYGSYTYDAWGNVISQSGSIASLNPIRYRGYYYDAETGLYYLGSRYYDPQVKRFINADGAAFATINPYGDGLTDKNYFAYCDNNPVSRSDDGGQVWIEAGISAVVGGLIGGVTAKITGGSFVDGAINGAVSGFITGASATISVATGAIYGAVTSIVAYENTSASSSAGGALIAAACGAVSGAAGGLVGVRDYGVIGTTVATYFTSLATGSLSMIGTTVADTLNNRKNTSSSTSTSRQTRTYWRNTRKKAFTNSRSRVAYLLQKIRRSRRRR